jgi:hypothetical protein
LIAKAGALAALERAPNAGVLTKDEYRAKKSALLASDAAVPASTLADASVPPRPAGQSQPPPPPPVAVSPRLILHFEKSRQGDRPGTLVTGETKRNVVGRVTQKSWTNAVLAQIACHLRERR